jgi:poly(A) polymerase
MNTSLNKYIQKLISIANSENCQIYMVGGSVRDHLIGRPCDDYDFTTKDAPGIAKLFANEYDLTLVILDDTHNRETIRVIIDKYLHFDFSTMQGENIEQDLGQRDFTINAMALTLPEFVNGKLALIDLHGGQADIENNIVRALPGSTFESDPLRMLRAYRFSAMMQFDIDPKTLSLIETHCSKIQQVAKERITHELLLYLETKTQHQKPFIHSGLLENIIPELKNRTNNSFSELILSNLEKNIQDPANIFKNNKPEIQKYLKTNKHKALLLLSGILSMLDANDSLSSSTIENKTPTPVRKLLSRLRMSNSEILFIERIIIFQKRAILEMKNLYIRDKNLRGIYNFVKSAGEEIIPSSILASSIFHAEYGENNEFNEFLFKTYDFYVKWYLPSQNSPCLINGNDLTNSFNLKPSPLFKSILDSIEEERVLKYINTREEAESRVKTLILESQQG